MICVREWLQDSQSDTATPEACPDSLLNAYLQALIEDERRQARDGAHGRSAAMFRLLLHRLRTAQTMPG